MRYTFLQILLFTIGFTTGGQLVAQEIEEYPHIEEIAPGEEDYYASPEVEMPTYDWEALGEEQVDKESFDPEAHAALQRELDYSGSPEVARRDRERRQREQRRNRQYYEDPEVSSSSDWQFGNITLSNTAFFIIVGLLLLGIGFFVYQYLDLADSREIKAPKEALDLKLEEIEEDQLTLTQTETLLERAERLGDFSTAVRMQYLALLKQLQELGMINYQRDKTDREYRREMDRTELGDVFSEITIDYARNWYGQYPLDRLSYRLVADRFGRLRNHLSNQNKAAYV